MACATVDPQTPSFDPSPLIPYLERLGVRLHYISTPIIEQAKVSMHGDSLCAFCARWVRVPRRGIPFQVHGKPRRGWGTEGQKRAAPRDKGMHGCEGMRMYWGGEIQQAQPQRNNLSRMYLTRSRIFWSCASCERRSFASPGPPSEVLLLPVPRRGEV